jgi:preprotein translocase subunit Sss1
LAGCEKLGERIENMVKKDEGPKCDEKPNWEDFAYLAQIYLIVLGVLGFAFMIKLLGDWIS